MNAEQHELLVGWLIWFMLEEVEIEPPVCRMTPRRFRRYILKRCRREA